MRYVSKDVEEMLPSFCPQPGNFRYEDDFVRAIFDGEAQTKIDQFRSSISLNRREKMIDSGTGPSIERSWNILEDAVLTGNDLSLSQER